MEMTARYRRPYHRLDEPLQVVLKSLSLDLEEVKETNERLHSLLNDNLLPEMHSGDPLFNQLFVRLHYMGSFYEGLRIKEPNEFDLNVELRLPDACCARVTSSNCPGFLRIKCDSSGVSSELKRWISKDGFLIRDKVLHWMQGVVDKALQNIYIPNIQISRSRSGPAVTLNITENGYFYSVDLVPVFSFNVDQWPKEPVRQPQTTVPSSQVWNAVPKGPLANGDTSKHWRMSFYNQEKRIMNNLGLMKPTIKLMKLLRDEEGWHQLSSYYIKTVALWVNDSNKNIWRCSLGVVFMEILSAFKTYLLDEKSIPFFWDQRHNLLSGLNKMEIDRIGNRIARIIKTIDNTLETSPEELHTVLYSLFGNEERNTRVLLFKEYIDDDYDVFYDTQSCTPASSPSSTSELTIGFVIQALICVRFPVIFAVVALAPVEVTVIIVLVALAVVPKFVARTVLVAFLALVLMQFFSIIETGAFKVLAPPEVVLLIMTGVLFALHP